MSHPTSEIDDAVHQRVRLGTLAIVNEVDEAEFGFIKDSLGVTAGNLSRHLDVLEGSGLVTIRKGHVGKRARTWIAVTPKGREAFEREVAALRALLATVPARAVETLPTDDALIDTPL